MKIPTIEQVLPKAKLIIPENGWGESGEVHITEYNEQNYILRICEKDHADQYEHHHNHLKNYGFLTPLLWRKGRHILFKFFNKKSKGITCKKQTPWKNSKKNFKQIKIIITKKTKINTL